MAYPYEDEDRRSALVQGLLAAGLAALGTRKGQEGQGLAQAGLLGLGGYNRSLDNSSDARDRRAMREMQAQQWSMSQQEHALKLKALQDAQAQQERMGGVYSRMPTNEPTAGVAPATAAQFGPGGGDSTGMAGMPPAPVTRLPLYEQYVKQGDYFQRAAQQYPKDAEKLMALAEKAYAAAQASRDENKGDIQFLTKLDGTQVAIQARKHGNPTELPGYGQKPNWSMQDVGGVIQPVNLNSATAPAVMTKTPTFADKNSAGQLGVAQSRLAWDKEGGKPTWDSGSGQYVFPPSVESPTGRAVAPLGFVKADKPLTESQSNAAAFGMRARAANDILNTLEDSGQQLGDLPGLLPKSRVGNYTAPAWAQKAHQAKLNFMTANLRKESGAAISPTEYKTQDEMYFPQPGDGPEVLTQKREMRGLAIESLAMQAGPGASKIGASNTSDKKANIKSTDSFPSLKDLPEGAVVTDNNSGAKLRKRNGKWEQM